MRMRKKKHLDTRMEQCDSLLVTSPQELRGQWLEQFKNNTAYGELDFNELHIELGCGKGRFIVDVAKESPDVLFIAIERISNVLVAAMELVLQNKLNNVKFINGWVDDVGEFFAEKEVSQIYLNFCDPWPANRHLRRRLTHQRFLDLYRNILKEKGEIHFKTDNLPLFEYSLTEFSRCDFALSEVSYNLHEHSPQGIMTDYEKRFHEQGLPIYRCVAV